MAGGLGGGGGVSECMSVHVRVGSWAILFLPAPGGPERPMRCIAIFSALVSDTQVNTCVGIRTKRNLIRLI